MRMRTFLLGIAAAVGLTACAEPRPAVTESLMSASAVVQSVDTATRRVELKGDDGATVSVVAGPEVRNLDQLAKGDRVTFNFYESVFLSMADPDAPAETMTVAAGRAPVGAKPGGAAVVATDVVVTVVSYNPNNGFATYRTPDGVIHRATVPPELRSFAAARAPGSKVRVSLTQAVAVSITEG